MSADSNGVTPVATRRHEFWVSDDPEDAVRKTKIVLKRLGALTQVAPQDFVEGSIKFGIYNAVLHATWRSESEDASLGKVPGAATARPASAATMMGTTLILQADCPGARDASTRETASKSAIERFEEAYLHFDNPDFKPDRLGLLPMTVIGVIVLLVLIGYALLHTPLVQSWLPKKPLTVSASPAPDNGSAAAPEASPDPNASPADGSAPL